MTKLFKTQLMLELRRAGYPKAAVEPVGEFVIPMPQYPNLQIMRGGVRYGPDWTDDERELAHGGLSDIHSRAHDACAAWDRSRPFPKECDAPENFRLVDEYADVAMAVRDDGPHGLHFVTWDYDGEHTGLSNGHYTTSYEGAKEDFAVRAGLIDANRLVAPEEARLIWRALKFQDGEDIGLTEEDEAVLDSLYERLERLDPSIGKPATRDVQSSEAQNAANNPAPAGNDGPELDMQMT